MIAAIKEARDAGNSLGGVVKCVVRGCPPGLGDPVFVQAGRHAGPTP